MPLTLFSQIIIGFWIVFMLYWLISAFNVKKTLISGNWKKGIIFRLVLVLLLIAVFSRPEARIYLREHAFSEASLAFGLVGLAVCSAGIALAVWARIYLGRNWGSPMSVKENPELITTGPYKYIRHPIYSGFLLAIRGSYLASGLIWLIILVITSPYFIYSSLMEDGQMEKQFGEKFLDYKRKTKLLIPFIF